MTPVAVMAGFALIAAMLIAIQQFESRLPRRVHQIALVIGLTVPALCGLYALWDLRRLPLSWHEVVLFAALYALTGVGTTLGWHRLLTHRSLETYPVIKLVLLTLGAMANQGRPIDWAADHLKHHAHADREGDPHSPLDGFLHAHVAWIVTAKPADRERYCSHLLGDPVVRFVDTTAALWVGVGLVIPFLVDGWSGLLWGGLIRIAIGNHVIFAVNSICHRFGDQPFQTRDQSRNNWWMALLSFGEGWHNNHHAFPSMAYHGMTARQIDITGLLIRLLASLQLVWNVQQPSPKQVDRHRALSGSEGETSGGRLPAEA